MSLPLQITIAIFVVVVFYDDTRKSQLLRPKTVIIIDFFFHPDSFYWPLHSTWIPINSAFIVTHKSNPYLKFFVWNNIWKK